MKPAADSKLPAPGTVFAVPQADGRFGLTRVLAHDGDGAALLVISPWIGTEAELKSALADPRAKQVLALTHHDWKGEPQRLWVSGAPPEGWRRLGVLPVVPDDGAPTSSTHGNWESAEFHPLEQWRWDHQRDAMTPNDDRAKAHARARRQRIRTAKRKKETFASLARKRWFRTWDPALGAPARKLVMDSLAQLSKPPLPKDPQEAFTVIRGAVDALNRLHAEQSNAIRAEQREDLLEAFLRIGLAAGLEETAVEAVVDTARSW